MSEAKKSAANSYVVVVLVPQTEVIGAWSNKDKAIRQAFEQPGKTAIQVFNPVTGELIETITKG